MEDMDRGQRVPIVQEREGGRTAGHQAIDAVGSDNRRVSHGFTAAAALVSHGGPVVCPRELLGGPVLSRPSCFIPSVPRVAPALHPESLDKPSGWTGGGSKPCPTSSFVRVTGPRPGSATRPPHGAPLERGVPAGREVRGVAGGGAPGGQRPQAAAGAPRRPGCQRVGEWMGGPWARGPALTPGSWASAGVAKSGGRGHSRRPGWREQRPTSSAGPEWA